MKTLLLTISVVLAQALATAQNQAGWSLYKTIEGVEIYTKETDCYAADIPSQKAILIQVINTNSYKCTIEWDLAIWYNNEQVTSNVKDGENHHIITLEPAEKLQGDCETPYGPFYIFKDFILYTIETKLTRFDLENPRVTRL